MATRLQDLVIRSVFLMVLAAPQSWTLDENKEWLWKLLTSLDDKAKPQDSPYTPGETGSPALQDLLSRTSQVQLDPVVLDDLKRQLSSSYQTDVDNRAQKRQFFGGLLCCNHPPTREPTASRAAKRGKNDDRFEEWIMSQLIKGAVAQSYDMHQEPVRTEDPYVDLINISPPEGEAVDMRWQSSGGRSEQDPYWDKRAKVTVVRGGFSDVNT